MPNVSNFGTQTDNAVVQGTVTDRAMVIPDIPPSGLESVGPRVTPHFVKPSLWSALTTYHFFDAVHDTAGASYVAIKPEVPAGTELTNEDYWFLWADPNSQFAELSELVKTFNGRITQAQADATKALLPTPSTRKVKAVIIGDSFTDPDYIGEGHRKWWQLLEDNGWECHVFAQKGAGFVQPSNEETGSRKFIDCVNDAVASTSFDHNSIERVIIYGGGNDIFNHWSSTPTEGTIANAMNACANALANSFPYADLEIYYGNAGQGWEITNDNIDLLSGPMLLFPKLNQKTKLVCATPWLSSYFRNASLCEAGYIHPNAQGHRLIANIIGTGTEYPTRSKIGDCFGPASTDEPNAVVNINGSLNCSGNGSSLIYGLKLDLNITTKQQIAAGTAISVTIPVTDNGFHIFSMPISFKDYVTSTVALRFIKVTNEKMTFNMYVLKDWGSQYHHISTYSDTEAANIVGY